MKIKRLIVFSVLIAMTILDVHGQSRTDRVNVEFDSKSEKLTQATGWEKNRISGEWIENQNLIADRKISQKAIGVSQNFNWLQLAKLTFKGEQYFLLIYESPTGRYRYPNLREEWISFESVYFFVFTSKQYAQMINSLDLMVGRTIKIKSNIVGEYSGVYIQDAGGYNEKDLLARITNRLNQPDYYEKCFLLNSQVVDGSEIVRFRLPEYCTPKEVEDKMKTAYFEVGLEDFKSILLESIDNEVYTSTFDEEDEGNEEVFVVVEQEPELIGGLEGLQNSVQYPEMARRAGIEGRVIVQFVVNKRGEVEDPRVIRSVGGGTDEEALRVVKLAEFRPGMEKGQPVKVQYSLPIVFSLED